jgi:hypothetical protein
MPDDKTSQGSGFAETMTLIKRSKLNSGFPIHSGKKRKQLLWIVTRLLSQALHAHRSIKAHQ